MKLEFPDWLRSMGFEEWRASVEPAPAVKPPPPLVIREVRPPRDIGIEVAEGAMPDGSELGIVDCGLVTVWNCPVCKTGWQKPGRHGGQLKTCRKCGSRFFLRRQDDSGARR